MSLLTRLAIIVALLASVVPAGARSQTAKERAADRLYREGAEALHKGNPADAVELLDLSRQAADRPATRALLSLALARQGKCEDARPMALAIAPVDAPAELREAVDAALREALETCPEPPPEQPGPEPALYVGVEDVEAERPPVDPGDDRVMLSPSAQTMAKGTMSFTDIEIGIAQFSWVPVDGLQVSLAMTVPVMQVALVPMLKWRFVNTPGFKMAAVAGGGFGIFYAGPDAYGAGGGGGLVGDVCLTEGCRTFLSIGSQAQVAKFGGAKHREGDLLNDWGWAVTSGLGAVVEVHRKVKLLFELRHSIASLASGGSGTDSLFTFAYGVRIHGIDFGADIGFVMPFLWLEGTTAHNVWEDFHFMYIPIGYPWLAFTYQW